MFSLRLIYINCREKGEIMEKAWLDKWKEDIDQLRDELPLLHKNIYFQRSQKDFLDNLEDLKQRLSKSNHYMVIIELARIIASFRDAHTTLFIPGSRFIPFKFYCFEEGIYIIGASAQYIDYINSRVISINGMPIDKIIAQVESVISHENEFFLKSQLPKYLSLAEVLYGLEIVDDIESIELEIEYLDGHVSKLFVETCSNLEYQKIMSDDIGYGENLPLYRQNRDMNFWNSYIVENRTFYINYSSCKDMEDSCVKNFARASIDFIKKNGVEKVVIDMRNNLGGNSTLFDPFISDLGKWKVLNGCVKIFVILGRDTFSSALLNVFSLKNISGTVLVGEGTGGKPDCYGEVQYLVLKNSKLRIRYSTKFYEIISDDKVLSLLPDVSFDVRFEDFLSGRDPCLEFVLGY